MTQRYRQEAQTLKADRFDERLVGQCELMRSTVNNQDGAAILKLPDLEAGWKPFEPRCRIGKRCCSISWRTHAERWRVGVGPALP